MSLDQIKSILESHLHADGLMETGMEGVRLFRATESVPCVPAVYEPCVVAVASGSKEVVLDGVGQVYDNARYLCCPMSMPLRAGTPAASKNNPLLGIYIALDPRRMTDLAIALENAPAAARAPLSGGQGIALADWDAGFTEAILRLLQLLDSEADMAALADARLREVYYAILKGDAGLAMRQAFGVGNAIARSIAHVSARLDAPVSIDDMARRAGMSRAVFHRKFKAATALSPIQFVKSMRLNTAAMRIASGVSVNEAALAVGYASASQFSREFRRTYGQSPRQWGQSHAAMEVSPVPPQSAPHGP